MGLLDELLGGALGKSGSQGGLSKPLMLAMLALLASGALNRRGASGGGAPQPAPSNNPLGDLLGSVLGGGRQVPGQAGNPLGDILGGLLGGGAAGGARQASPAPAGHPLGDILGNVLGGGGSSGGALAGGLLGGLGSVLGQLQQSGQEDTIKSWIGTGQNREISAREVQSALSPEVIRELSGQTGLSPDELLAQISTGLPDLVDQLTPEGRLPSVPDDPALSELSRLSRQLG